MCVYDCVCVCVYVCVCVRVWASLVAQTVKNPPAVQETQIQSWSWEDLLEKRMETYSSILAWRIPRAEETGRLQSMGCKELDMTDQLTLYIHI